MLAQMPGVGTQVIASVEINRDALSFDLKDGKQSADLDIGGIFYDDKGKPVNSFVGRLRIFPVPEDASAGKTKASDLCFPRVVAAGLISSCASAFAILTAVASAVRCNGSRSPRSRVANIF